MIATNYSISSVNCPLLNENNFKYLWTKQLKEMAEDVRIWKIIDDDNLHEIKKGKLDLEKRIEDWIEKDISIITGDLLIIGRQVETAFGGVIDLLCIDYMGDLVIVELKRDKTPREITAQALDYASWVQDLSNDKINELANEYLRYRGPLEEAFKKHFNCDLPDILNEHHKMYVVASEIDSSSESIINYLSDTHGIGINAVTFHYFVDDSNKEYLARLFLIEPSQVEYRTHTKTTSKRAPPLTYDELRKLTENIGVNELYEPLVNGLTSIFDGRHTTRSSIAFDGKFEDSKNCVFSIIPEESNSEDGLRFQVYIYRLADFLGIEKEQAISLLPKKREPWKYYESAPEEYSGFVGYFKTLEEVKSFVQAIEEIKKH